MPKAPRYFLVGLLVPLILAAAAVYGLYRAARRVPKFYSAELAVERQLQESDSNRMVQQAVSLHNELHHRGPWHEDIEAKMINAWLAVEMPRNFPDLLPPGMRDPASASARRESRSHARSITGGFTASSPCTSARLWNRRT